MIHQFIIYFFSKYICKNIMKISFILMKSYYKISPSPYLNIRIRSPKMRIDFCTHL